MDTIENLRAILPVMPCAFAQNGSRNDITSTDSSIEQSTNLYNGFTAKQALAIAYDWKSEYDYAINDICTVSGTKYKCVEDHTSSDANKPPIGAEWETYWALTTEETGIPVLRGDLNQLAYLGSDDLFYQMCGGTYSAWPDPLNFLAIGGYPEGAVYMVLRETDRQIRYMKCILEGGNNTYEPSYISAFGWKDVSAPVSYCTNSFALPTKLFSKAISLNKGDSGSAGPVSIGATGFAYCGGPSATASVLHADGTRSSFDVDGRVPIYLRRGDAFTASFYASTSKISGTFYLAYR